MKKGSIILILLLCITGNIYAQAPESINYQAVIRNDTGLVLFNININLKISILQDSINGEPSYSETHSTSTNDYGMVTLAIGTGTSVLGDFTELDWANNNYFMKVELDLTGLNNYHDMGTIQILSVPYALEAKHSSSLTLSDTLGNKYTVTIDTEGNLITTLVGDTIYGMPCPGIPTVTYMGQVYNTVQIGTQCWLRENLNVGLRIDGIDDQTANDTIEKYCYDDIEDNCDIYGGLYQWNEMMQYVADSGAQGICPEGWHLPTDNEIFVMENYVDTTIVNPNLQTWRGVDAGIKLAEGGLSGFDCLYSGARKWDNASFYDIETQGWFYSSTINPYDPIDVWFRRIHITESGIYRNGCSKLFGLPARCLKDN